MSVSLHFAYINSYMHTFIYSVNISIWYFINEQIHWKSSQVVQSYKFFLVTKRTIQLSLIILIHGNIFFSSDPEIWRRGALSVQHGMPTSCKSQRNRGWATKLLPNDGLSTNHLSWNLDASGEIIRPKARFRRTLCGSIQNTRFRRLLWARGVKERLVYAIKCHQATTETWFTWAKAESYQRPEYTQRFESQRPKFGIRLSHTTSFQNVEVWKVWRNLMSWDAFDYVL